MSTLYIHIGQCGLPFWCLANSELNNFNSEYHPLFYRYKEKSYCRCILVDSEPKVLQQFKDLANIKSRNILSDTSGRANNWALGYNDSNRKHPLYSKAIEIIRQELEETDFAKGIVFVYSTGGGTGSGLGSRILTECRNEFGSLNLLPIIIHPSWNGDTPLQYYNTILTWKTIKDYADSCIYFENDYLMNIALNQREWKKNVSISNINSIIATNLAGLFFPIVQKTRRNKSPYFEQFDWSMFYYNLPPLSSMKFMELYSTPIININNNRIQKQNSLQSSWNSLNQNLLSLIYKYNNKKQQLYTISMYNIIRGNSMNDYSRYENEILTKTTRNVNLLGMSDGIQELISKDAFPSAGVMRSITTCIHRNAIVDSMKYCLNKATLMYDARAYLNWYNKYGLENSQLEESFNDIHSIVDEYINFRKNII